jgi:hypothetical protein
MAAPGRGRSPFYTSGRTAYTAHECSERVLDGFAAYTLEGYSEQFI